MRGCRPRVGQTMRHASECILAGGLARRMGGATSRCFRSAGGRSSRMSSSDSRRNARLSSSTPMAIPIASRRLDWRSSPTSVRGFRRTARRSVGGDGSVAKCRPDDGVSAPADTPFLPRDLVERLARARSAVSADIAVAASGEQGASHRRAMDGRHCGDDLRHALVEEDVRRVRSSSRGIRTRSSMARRTP